MTHTGQHGDLTAPDAVDDRGDDLFGAYAECRSEQEQRQPIEQVERNGNRKEQKGGHQEGVQL